MFLTPDHLGSDEGPTMEIVLRNLIIEGWKAHVFDLLLQCLGEAYVGIAKRDLYSIVSTPVSNSKKIARN